MIPRIFLRHSFRSYSKSHYDLIIAGGGTAGASSAHNFVNVFDKCQVAVIEPSNEHFYQPMWTLVGAGIKKFDQSVLKMHKALPGKAVWLKNSVIQFNPDNNEIKLCNGEKITYKYLIVALGIKLDYDQIEGATEALEKDSLVCSNYSKDYVNKTFQNFQSFKEGNALFSFPNTVIKCAGAPQKIMYLFDDYLRKNNKRNNASIQYYTSLPQVFGVKKYSDKLTEICKSRNLSVTTKHHLVQVDPLKREATFENIETKERKKLQYDMLHISPPMTGMDVIKESKLADPNGFVDVDKETLQHVRYPNVFALGDCSNLPTIKTAAAIASQQNILYQNLKSFMKTGDSRKMLYDGYTSCPLLTKYNKCILAEFDYNKQPLETFPWSQDRESRVVYYMKSHMMPQLYWKGLIKGYWNGPETMRKILHMPGDKLKSRKAAKQAK